MPEWNSCGDIVERQTYLNGTRYYLIEGTVDAELLEWSWTLAVTLPKNQGDSLEEGDLSLVGGARAWYGDVTDGRHRDSPDDLTGATLTAIEISLQHRAEADSTESWRTAQARIVLLGDTAELTLSIDPEAVD